MSDSANWQRWIVFSVLALQIVWIANQLRLVMTDQINPWRLGGYGMYTVPFPVSSFEVYSSDSPDVPLPVNKKRFEMVARLTNPSRTFRCADVSPESLLGFFDENSFLIGTKLIFTFKEERFIHVPPSVENQVQGVVDVDWQDDRTFTATNKFCGKEHAVSVVLP
jgi:hypothetical protein